ncbi:hypothetical protein JR316_0005102 [Psilocybe cubensis]|uniref:Uncharacterized protein n=2 Tax=Psilocybe cubensis TaxID=181762 RepID=A0A8H7XX73_PSICU|nr:hypothetical protein JR316_0005102 [Psilocybe cubensis]KAH9483002.1 hypothetical protein JR316_0005102 [Psilocybe cubensis]
MAILGLKVSIHPRGDAQTDHSHASTVLPESVVVNLFPPKPYWGMRLDLIYVWLVALVAVLTIVAIERYATALPFSISTAGKTVCSYAHSCFNKPPLIPLGGSCSGSIELNAGEKPIPQPRPGPPIAAELVDSSGGQSVMSNIYANRAMEPDSLPTADFHTEIPQDCTEDFAFRIFQQGARTPCSGLLLVITLVFLGYLGGILVVRLSRKLLRNIIEASLDNSTCEEIQNIVPGTLLDGVPSDQFLRNASHPLECVFLTPSGPCTIDPRSIRQITVQEEEQTFGLPSEALGSRGSPEITSLPSCFTSIPRPGRPKSSLKVTFSEDHEVLILPPNTVTRDRNLRRRLSRRVMAAAGSVTDVTPIAKRQ